MPASTLTLFQDFKEQLAKGKHDLSAHSFKVCLSNTAPSASANTVLADITQIAAGNGYVSGGFDLDSETLSETGGVAKWTIADEVITAAGGSMAAFRYAVVYNDTQSTPAKPVVGFYDYGSSVTLGDGESLTLDFDGTNGVLTIT